MTGTALISLDGALAPYADAGMPEGALELATERAVTAARLASALLQADVAVDALSVALLLHLPEVMAASYGSAWWPTPPAPRPAPGGGWYNAELGGPDNAVSFERLVSTLPPGSDATALAAAAQEWRLPVCDYRPRSDSPPWRDEGAGEPEPGAHRVPARATPAGQVPAGQVPAGRRLLGLRVLDLTSMWAGPLATWLLARLGADVVKIEPTVRPDGFRARHGRGVWPGGRARRADGSESAVFNALNSDKRSWALDGYDDRHRLQEVAGAAELVVDSFSPRVMGQLGLAPARNGCDRAAAVGGTPAPVHLSMPAFPSGPLRQWVAYGTGVHALSGLGHHPGDGAPFRQPGLTYPDPLAGLQGAVIALEALCGVTDAVSAGDREVSLAAALEPLLDRRRRLLPVQEGTGTALLRAAVEQGAVTPVADGGGVHWYPVGPFRFPGSRPPRPAPARAQRPPQGVLPWTR